MFDFLEEAALGVFFYFSGDIFHNHCTTRPVTCPILFFCPLRHLFNLNILKPQAQRLICCAYPLALSQVQPIAST